MPKKRTKKYRPKPCRPASMLYRIEELTEEERTEMETKPFLALRLLELGEGTTDAVVEVQSMLHLGWVMARGFDEKWNIRLLFTLAYACLNGVYMCLNKNMEVPKCVFEPIRQALETVKDMRDSLTRSELLSSARVTADSDEIFYDIPRNAGWVVKPNLPKDDPIIGRRAFGVINGKLRTGYLNVNHEMDDRLEWISPTEGDLKIPITRDFVVLLTEPLTEEEVGKYEKFEK